MLDAGLKIYQWHGKTSNVWEKNKVRDIRIALVAERNGIPKSYVVDDLQEDSIEFWEHFGIKGAPK